MTAPLAVQLYSVRDAVTADPAATFTRLAEIGFRQVEGYDFVERAPVFAAALAANGLTMPSGHARLVEADDITAVFAAAAELGMTTVIDPAVPAERWTTRAGVAAVAARLNALVEPAAEHGLRVGYHNHWWESADLDGTPALELLAADLDERVVLEVDAYWVEAGGRSAPELIRRLGSRVELLHVKDGPLTRETRAQLPAGQGDAPIPEILAAAPDAVRVVEFDDYAGEIFDGLSASLAYLADLP